MRNAAPAAGMGNCMVQTMTHPTLNVDGWDTGDPAVLVADGYSVTITVRGGYLVVTDGVPSARRVRRVPRVGHPMTVLIVLGRVGYVTFEARRWMTELGIRYAEIDTEVITVGANGFRDWRAIVGQVCNGLPAMRYLIGIKLDHQARFLERLGEVKAAKYIRRSIDALREDDLTLDDVGNFELQAGMLYWRTWQRDISIPWHPRDLVNVPEHWTRFPGRMSMRKGISKNRSASDPLNALLNYSYKIAETAAYAACGVYGMEPAVGVMHNNRDDYDAFVFDLIEPLRPWSDERVYDYLQSIEWFDRRWCHEVGTGQVLIDPPVTHMIAGWFPAMLAYIMPHTRRVRDLLCANATTSRTRQPSPAKRTIRQRRS